MKLDEIFDEIAQQMQSDFEKVRKATDHPGLKGNVVEESFRTFLRNYLPQSLDISTGILVDPEGRTSKQLDIIISDAAKTPIFYKSGDMRVIPIECTYSVIEVKTFLDVKELDRTFENMKSVRELKKKAYFAPSPFLPRYTYYGQQWEIWPVNYFIFAANSIELPRLADHIYERHQAEQLPEWSRIDTVCVLNKGVIANSVVNDGKVGSFNALPYPTSHMIACPTSRSLLLFYSLISHLLHQAKLPDFRITDYTNQLNYWPVTKT